MRDSQRGAATTPPRCLSIATGIPSAARDAADGENGVRAVLGAEADERVRWRGRRRRLRVGAALDRGRLARTASAPVTDKARIRIAAARHRAVPRRGLDRRPRDAHARARDCAASLPRPPSSNSAPPSRGPRKRTLRARRREHDDMTIRPSPARPAARRRLRQSRPDGRGGGDRLGSARLVGALLRRHAQARTPPSRHPSARPPRPSRASTASPRRPPRSPPARHDAPSTEHEHSFDFFGTRVRLLVALQPQRRQLDARCASTRACRRLHRALTPLRPGSELSQLNARAGDDGPRRRPLLLRAVEAALFAARRQRRACRPDDPPRARARRLRRLARRRASRPTSATRSPPRPRVAARRAPVLGRLAAHRASTQSQ